MSVFDKLKAYSRKPAAVILATVMATSTIPTTPIAQAVTAAYAESTTAESAKGNYSYAESTWYDTLPTIRFYVDTHAANGKKGAVYKLSKDEAAEFVKPAMQVTDSYGKRIKQAAVDDVLANQIPDGRIVASKDDITIDNFKIEDVEVSSVELDGDPKGFTLEKSADGWIITSPDSVPNDSESGVTAGILLRVSSITFSYDFSYKYTTKQDVPSAAEGQESTTGVDVAQGNPEKPLPSDSGANTEIKSDNGNVSKFKLEQDPATHMAFRAHLVTQDYWKGVDSKIPYVKADPVTLTYGANDNPVATIADVDGAHSGQLNATFENGKTTTENDYYKAELVNEDGAWKVKFTPKKVFSAAENPDGVSVNVKWAYPDSTAIDGVQTPVTVSAINKCPIDKLSLPGDKDGKYAYRIKDAQQKKILKDANDAVKQAVKAIDGKEPSENYYSAVDLDVDANGAANSSTALSFTVNPDEKAVAEYANFNVTDVPTANIDAVASVAWEKTDLVVKSDNGGSNSKLSHEDYKNGTWLNGNGTDHDGKVTASWTDYALSDEVPTEMSKLGNNLEMNMKEGVSENNQMYALNSDGVVTLVTGICYRRDTWAPVVMSAAVSNKENIRPESITKKLEADHKYVTKNLQVAVNIVDYGNNSDKSGLKDDSVKMNYSFGTNDRSDTGNSKEVTPDSSNKGTFVFDLSKNGANQRINSNNMNVSAYDKAGNHIDNVSVLKAETPMEYLELVQNADAPTVAAAFDNNNVQREVNGRGYYNANRTFTVSVTDPFFKYVQDYDPNQVIATLEDGGETTTITPGMLTRSNGDTWTYSYTFGAKGDADCKVSAVNYANLAGTTAAPTFSGETFTIDKTAPKLNVSWNTEAAQNGKYYNAARTATITVEEHNFDPNLFKIEAPVSAGNGDEATPAQIGGWTSNGDTHTATVTFPGQGVYTLSVSGEDLASNKSESYTSPEFVIDTIKPKIDIQNVVNRTAYAGEVAPSAAVHDTNLADGTTIEVSKISYPLSKDDPNPYAGAAINTSATDKSVSYLNPAKTKGNDGVYTLTVQAIDLAGNTESEAVTWSVNRFGSTYVISDNTGKMLDQYLKSSKTTDVKVTEINPSGLDDNKTSVELTRDTKNTTLKSGDNYTTDSDTSSGWSEYNYTVSKSNYDKDGAYRVLFHSEDAAGNSSENTMEGKNAKKTGAAAEINFAVDDTAPIASFVDLASNGKYEESSHKAKVSFEDNLKLSKAQIKVNGKTVATFTADQLEKSPIREFTLDGSSSKQDVTVVAWDAAGNKSKELKATGVLVTNDSFVLWMNNLPLMVGTIVAIVVVAGGIYLVVAKKRKENEEN